MYVELLSALCGLSVVRIAHVSTVATRGPLRTGAYSISYIQAFKTRYMCSVCEEKFIHTYAVPRVIAPHSQKHVGHGVSQLTITSPIYIVYRRGRGPCATCFACREPLPRRGRGGLAVVCRGASRSVITSGRYGFAPRRGSARCTARSRGCRRA